MKRNKSIVISYMNMRILIGLLGMALPAICYLWCIVYNDNRVLDSISMHYYTNFRDLFVGTLITFSVFLISYKGYDALDNAVTMIIGISGIGIALFPCGNPGAGEKVSFMLLDSSRTSVIHYISAGAFFSLLSFNSFFLFTKSKARVQRGSRKHYRNIVYKVCGVVIIVALISMLAALLVTTQEFRDASHILMVQETIMLAAFGVSWLVKGGALIRDIRQR